MKILKQIWAYIRYIVLSDELSFDVRITNMVCLVGVTSLSLATIVHIAIRSSLPLISVMLSLVFCASFFLYLTYRYRLYNAVLWIIITIICDVMLPVSVFLLGGADSGVAAFCVMGTTAILLVTRGRQRIILVSTNVLLLIACFLFAAYNPMWVEQFDAAKPLIQTIDNIKAYLVSTLFIGACIFFQGYMYTQEKKRVEQANAELEKERQVTFALFDASPHINALFNDKLELIDCNPAALKIFGTGVSKEKLLKNLYKIIEDATPTMQPDGRPSASMGIWLNKAVHEGEVNFETALDLYGNTHNISITMKRIRYEDSFAIVAYLVDQTELYAARREALESAKAKGAFLANMSHEIRTPLNAVISMTSIGRDATETARKDYAFEHIGDAADHLLGVINDILDMSKIEADKFEINKTAFNLEGLLHRVANVIGFKMGEKRQQFSVFIDEDVPSEIVADEQRVAQVITNLLSNAVKFTPERGSIEVWVNLLERRSDGDVLLFSVRDSGIGIAEDQLERVFNSFEQAEKSTTRKFGGTGLGLAISKRFVEMMDGKMWVTSDLGAGSNFQFTLRVGFAEESAPVALDPSIKPETLRCLVVCSEQKQCEQSGLFLKRLGIPCDLVADKKDAEKLLSENHYDVCFMSWRIDGGDRFGLARWIKADKPADHVIVYVCPHDLAEIESSDMEGIIDGYITLPLFLSDFIKKLNALFGDGSDEEEPEHDIAHEDFSDCRLLLAEDMELNKEIVYALLEPHGFSLEWAKDGREAVELFEAKPESYDLILMDMQMPEMDGLEATKKIRALDAPRAQSVPIIALTANVFKEDVDRSIAAGMNDHLGKPIDLQEVLTMLHHYLREN